MNLAEIIKRIEQRIAELKTTDRAISIRAGMSADGIRNWKRRAESDPKAGANAQSLAKVASALDVSISWLTTGSENASDGFSEQAEAWTPHAHAAEAVARLYAGSARNPAGTYRAKADLPGFGILSGDLLVCDLSRLPRPGDIALLTVADPETGESRTIIRRYLPPFMISGGIGIGGEPESADNPNVTPRYPIIGTIRGA